MTTLTKHEFKKKLAEDTDLEYKKIVVNAHRVVEDYWGVQVTSLLEMPDKSAKLLITEEEAWGDNQGEALYNAYLAIKDDVVNDIEKIRSGSEDTFGEDQSAARDNVLKIHDTVKLLKNKESDND